MSTLTIRDERGFRVFLLRVKSVCPNFSCKGGMSTTIAIVPISGVPEET